MSSAQPFNINAFVKGLSQLGLSTQGKDEGYIELSLKTTPLTGEVIPYSRSSQERRDKIDALVAQLERDDCSVVKFSEGLISEFEEFNRFYATSNNELKGFFRRFDSSETYAIDPNEAKLLLTNFFNALAYRDDTVLKLRELHECFTLYSAAIDEYLRRCSEKLNGAAQDELGSLLSMPVDSMYNLLLLQRFIEPLLKKFPERERKLSDVSLSSGTVEMLRHHSGYTS